ncbi:MAG: prepilin-type N-terminal cleavage/methylation domain-containing protein [Clostridia bacterium]|nr:prepilin-type N-terminal cleavage/methylation domain-containing protein [Clostridia bacterium]
MKFLNSKKGFSLTELMMVVIVMGILVVVAVPIYSGVSKQKRVDECTANRIVISTVVQEAMVGMIDNGKKQDSIIMEYADPAHVVFSPANFPEGYANVKCFMLTRDELTAFTLGDLRGGYRTTGDYSVGCESGHYLKRKNLEDVKFYTYLANQEIPQCAFEEPDKKDYNYYIFSDATVLCDCEKCLENIK